MKNKLAVGITIALLLALPAAIAAVVYTTTQVQFNVGTVVAYTLTLPGQSSVTANSTGAPTTGIEFNSSTGTGSNLNPSVAGGTSQSDGTPIFSYDNTGTVDLNVSVKLNSNTPACITLKGATTYAGADSGTTITSSANTTVVNNFTPAASAQAWYMKADYSGCTTSDTATRTLTSYGVS